MKTDKHIDWLSITIPSGQNWRNFIPFSDLYLTGKGRHGYGKSYVDRRTGATIETASTRDDMGTHMTLSGGVLNAMRDDLGMIDDALIRRMYEWDAKCSRIDLAIDVYGASLTPKDLNAELLGHSAHLPARTWRFIDGHSAGVNGQTLDTGSPKSDRRFRFYDKAAEQRIKDGEAWVRLELQLRRLYAKSVAGSCAENGVKATITGTIGAYLSWENTEYHEILTGESSVAPVIPRRDGNRKRWLLGQVAKALADECVIDPFFRERFNQAVNLFYEQRLDKDKQNR